MSASLVLRQWKVTVFFRGRVSRENDKMNSFQEIPPPKWLARAITVLWAAGIIAVPFQRLWALPVFGAKLQPPELLFLPLCLTALLYGLKQRWQIRFSLLDACVPVWLAANLLAGLHAGLSRGVIIELLTAVYLLLLYVSIRLTVRDDLLGKFPKFMAISATIAAVFGIAGWLLATCGVNTPLAWPATTAYPYLGHVARAQGFTPSPNMLASILMIGIICLAAHCSSQRQFGRLNLAMLGIMLTGFALTLSKTVFCLLLGLLLVWHFTTAPKRLSLAWRRALVWTGVAGLFVLYNFGSHFILVRADDPGIPGLVKSAFIADEPLARWGPRLLMPTNYLINKRASLIAGRRSFPWGLGPGNYNAFIGKLQAEGRHPAHFHQWDPHSTYFGALAELGVLGLLAVLALWLGAGYAVVAACRRGGAHRGLAAGLAACFATILTEAVVTDVMNFRHYWWLLALAAALAAPIRSPAARKHKQKK